MAHTSVGIIADVQYADRDDRNWYINSEKTEFDPSKTRYYRGSFEQFKRVAQKSQSQPELDAFVQLGDLIDNCAKTECNNAEKTLDVLLETLDSVNAKQKLNVVGNHDIYAAPDRAYLAKKYFDKVDLKADCFAYRVDISEKVSIVHVDTYDLAVIGRHPDSVQYSKATEILDKNNPNEHKGSTKGMTKPLEKRFVTWTGGVSETQLGWIDETLDQLDAENRMAIIIAHCPIHPETITQNNDSWLEVCLTWNYNEVMALLDRHKSVQFCLTGHNHVGGRARSEKGVNYIGFKGLIENAATGCNGVLKFYENFAELEGNGACKSQKFDYRE